MQLAAHVSVISASLLERLLQAAEGSHALRAGASTEERLFRQLLAISRQASQYGNILEEINDPHFDINLDEFRGEL